MSHRNSLHHLYYSSQVKINQLVGIETFRQKNKTLSNLNFQADPTETLLRSNTLKSKSSYQLNQVGYVIKKIILDVN